MTPPRLNALLCLYFFNYFYFVSLQMYLYAFTFISNNYRKGIERILLNFNFFTELQIHLNLGFLLKPSLIVSYALIFIFSSFQHFIPTSHSSYFSLLTYLLMSSFPLSSLISYIFLLHLKSFARFLPFQGVRGL